MPSLTACLALLLSIALGCSARVVLEDTSADDDEEEEPECTPQLEPGVEDCAREAPDAVPLARLVGDGFHLAADDEFLYYTSDGRVLRLSMIGGEPEALTPDGSAWGAGSIKYADGFVYWTHENVVQRVPKAGGEPEALVELAPAAEWAVAGQAILSGGTSPEPSPLHRTSLITGETSELLAEDPEQFIQGIGVADDRALVTLSQSLVSVPLDGGEPQLLASGGMARQAPIAHDGHIYFGSSFPENDYFNVGILRVDIDNPSTPEVFLRGFPVAFAFDDDALYGHVVPGPDVAGEKIRGSLVRAALAGGDPEHITYTNAYRDLGYTYSSNGLVVSGCNVYFIDTCSDGEQQPEYRLVTMSKEP